MEFDLSNAIVYIKDSVDLSIAHLSVNLCLTRKSPQLQYAYFSCVFSLSLRNECIARNL